MPDSLSADVVVIGAGIAGSLAALKMAQAGASVLMLESGPEIKRDNAVELFRNSPFKGDFYRTVSAAALGAAAQIRAER
ncbi:Coenzyme F420-reducing hydrogenase, delta subunit [Serratia rubidaea]|nr:Coenzyme F420-reducing hydrogenase, delta subunit [Serratia rubidaea]